MATSGLAADRSAGVDRIMHAIASFQCPSARITCLTIASVIVWPRGAVVATTGIDYPVSEPPS
jgi:hypothetical protein